MNEDLHSPPLDPARVELLSRAARAARELCELLWEAMHEELRDDPRQQRVRELSERLGQVSSTVAMLSARPRAGGAPGERRAPPEPVAAEPSGERPSHLEPVFFEPAPSRPAPAAAPEPEPPAPIPHPAAAQRERSPSEPAAEQASTVRAVREASRMRLVDEHEQRPAGQPPAGEQRVAGEQRSTGELRSTVHREEGASAWINTVGRLLERHSLDGLPFAVLLVEVVDVAHIERSESPVQVNDLIAQVEQALERGLRAEDTLTRESFGRYWLVASETNGTGARMLAERLARLVRTSASHRGVPLEVAIGIAVCPDDGTEAPTLAARADLGVYSARANKRPVARTDPPA